MGIYIGPEVPREPELGELFASGTDAHLHSLYASLEEYMESLSEETDPSRIRQIIYPFIRKSFHLKEMVRLQEIREERAAGRKERREKMDEV
jgi:hypothetical protein